MTEDGSLYRLCKAGSAITNMMEYLVTYHNFQGGVTGTCGEGALAEAIAAGDESCVITDATNSRAADYWKGGYVIQPRLAADNIRNIWKSDAEVSNTYRLHVTAPFTVADDVGNTVNWYPSPYADVRPATGGSPLGATYDRVIGYVGHAVTSGYYFWAKVRGPHWCHIGNGGWPGAAANDRAVCAYAGGTLAIAYDAWGSDKSLQYLGFLMYADNYGDAMIMLAIE